MSLSLLGSLVSTASDTARSTFRAMADAARPPADAAPISPATPATPPATPVASTQFVAEPAAVTPKPANGQRLGGLLDAYA